MKQNGYDKLHSDYYIGLDVGTNSVGWAVTDKDYRVMRSKGKAMWGVRLFEEGNTAAERRTARTSRRRLQRRKQRLQLLELLFNNEICKIDPLFFVRLHNSRLQQEDKEEGLGQYNLFNDSAYNDRDYHKDYQTAYHLRADLVASAEPHDPRLVFLALHHILKSRGHFLFDIDKNSTHKSLGDVLGELEQFLKDQYGKSLDILDQQKFESILSDKNISISIKKKLLKDCVSEHTLQPEDGIDISVVVEVLSGAKVKLADLFNDPTLKKSEPASFSVKDDMDEVYDMLSAQIGDNIELLPYLKAVYDAALLSQILEGDKYRYFCDAKVAQFDSNSEDLKQLKSYVRQYAPTKYSTIFRLEKDKLNNFAAYMGKNKSGKKYSCKQEDFCKYLKKELSAMKDEEAYSELYKKIEDGTLLPNLKGSDNSVVPNQLHRQELIQILDNAETYLPFLKEQDEQGISVKDKIISLFDFKIPYYVGPLNKKSPNSWIIRNDEKIYPWNFEQVVDLEKSAERFMKNLINRCTYTGEDVIPMDSLLYSRYMVLNELNPLKVSGKPITVEMKQYLFHELFEKSCHKVTKKSIYKVLLAEGMIRESDEISGIDDVIKSKLRSYHDFKDILERYGNEAMAEEIIRSVLIFGEDKKMLRIWLKKNYPILQEDDIRHIGRLKYKDWGRLSKTFLSEIHMGINGEEKSIMDMLYQTNNNLNQLLSSNFTYLGQCEAYKKEKFGSKETINDMLDELYLSPAVKRSILQTVKIVDEIVDIQKSAPEKIFIEVTRKNDLQQKGKRTTSRKENLLELYKQCKKESGELYKQLKETDENDLRRDALYLYYTQFGKCMYSGEPIDVEQLAYAKENSIYDIDHIFPQSKVKDDSLDNRVLVLKELNAKKTNEYPIKEEIQEKMQPFWRMLKGKGLISQKKYDRLVRVESLTDEELSAFVQRQLIETSQSTKALATVFKALYGEAGTKLVYSKAGNVSDFRYEKKLIKCREINDLHHAKDAYLNIVVGNVYDTKFTEQFFKNIHSETYSLNRVFAFDVPGAWDTKKSMDTVREMMSKNNILVTRKAHHAKGAFSDLQIVAAPDGQLPIKQGLSTEKYGGYNKVAGAYFCLVEHTEKKQRVRSIEPVYIYQKKLYETDPLYYCREILAKNDPKIICPKILIEALVDIDGRKLCITGRSNGRLLCKHPYQFIVDSETEKYIKALHKYVERCKSEKIQFTPTVFDGITVEKNLKLYHLFVEKLQSKVYGSVLDSVNKHCEKYADEFTELSIYEQSVLLSEILKSFKCNREASDLSLLHKGPSKAGVITQGPNLNKVKSAFLVHQSVTGLYEYKEDLLR